ncbi:EPD1-interacting receptor-like cytoplasmic serine/threonine-protein kinase [Bidens hawaiensis]|uniref:EPD1-interacting receptor-like cytoplasmic serine/threonine-protein kinase n=1 Tax=Bidens hawaiensis TaxID=980011 RepID=UPI00404AFCC9
MKQVRAHIQSPDPSLKKFRFDDLEEATKKFSPDLLLGEGGFGKLVKITSYAHAPDILSWGTRLLIMIGIARGLKYLHSANIIHRALSSFNILLDNNFEAKLGGFGLVKYGPDTGETHVTTRVMGTHGYAAPEYITTGHLTTKADIYGFGVVLLESITGQKAMDGNRPIKMKNLLEWAIPILSKNKNLKKVMDPRLEYNYSRQGALKCTALVLRYVAINPKDRPSSEEVLKNLEQIYALHS